MPMWQAGMSCGFVFRNIARYNEQEQLPLTDGPKNGTPLDLTDVSCGP